MRVYLYCKGKKLAFRLKNHRYYKMVKMEKAGERTELVEVLETDKGMNMPEIIQDPSLKFVRVERPIAKEIKRLNLSRRMERFLWPQKLDGYSGNPS